jgi:hypothetical protein
MFGLFLEFCPDEAADYPFGREPDGAPSQRWIWQEPTSQSRGLRIKTAGHLVQRHLSHADGLTYENAAPRETAIAGLSAVTCSFGGRPAQVPLRG